MASAVSTPRTFQDLPITLNYLAREELYQTVKPFLLNYASETAHHHNLIPHVVRDVTLRDIRGRESDIEFQRCGFGIIEMSSAMHYDDYFDDEKVKAVYCTEIGNVLLQHLRASSIQIFDYAARDRADHSLLPRFTLVCTLRYEPPVFEYELTKVKILHLMPFKVFGIYVRESFITVHSVWKPLKGPVHDWPLALCDASTVDTTQDLTAMDFVMKEDAAVENIQVYHNEAHEWYYLSDQSIRELLVFRQGGSNGESAVPHTSFENPTPTGSDSTMQLRESIEIRALVYFD
ncbi:hypothetical protein CJF31_00003809 [Rutstroemia sp. NJR-2017a BVV2]|nr:hypothetical protein CJF31_00003809 [Rutstroemia sp. NJR-2017a BVV2]